ncbi:cuticle protein 14-like [Centruroides vittatus]|uniref:cuticle protein 14-like n=1 Tax=Centruroides vittatus TaxID=120091 RepID=UPI0035107F76
MHYFQVSLIVLSSVVAIVLSGYVPDIGGNSDVYQTQDNYGNYNFGYGVRGPYGSNNFREEKGNAYGHVRGSYGLTDADGRKRIVDYVADDYGFRAKVRSNEPGGASSTYPDPAYSSPLTALKFPLPGVYSGPYRYVSTPYAKASPYVNYPYHAAADTHKVVSAYPPY